MAMLQNVVRFFWPSPPNKISDASRDALRADMKAVGVWGKDLDDANRRTVDVWVRHADNLNRAAIRAWLAPRAKTYAMRWAAVSLVACVGAFVSSGLLVVEVPMTLAAITAGVIATGFLIGHRVLNK